MAIGQTPLNFEENFFFEVKIKSRAVFEEACLIGISDKWMYRLCFFLLSFQLFNHKIKSIYLKKVTISTNATIAQSVER